MQKLLERLLALAESLKGDDWEHPLMSREACIEAAKELVRLQAIVDRLPKTADGVPVAPDMTLYTQSEVVCSYHHGDTASGRYPRFPTLCEMVCDSGRRHYAEVEVSECYSTREAAEKAAKVK